MAVLVTGGAGYIGSHTCVELLENNKEVVVLDNLSNSSEEALNRVKRITGREVKFYKGDISDIVILDTIFKKENIEHVSFCRIEVRRRICRKTIRVLPEQYCWNINPFTEIERIQCKKYYFLIFSNRIW